VHLDLDEPVTREQQRYDLALLTLDDPGRARERDPGSEATLGEGQAGEPVSTGLKPDNGPVGHGGLSSGASSKTGRVPVLVLDIVASAEDDAITEVPQPGEGIVHLNEEDLAAMRRER